MERPHYYLLTYLECLITARVLDYLRAARAAVRVVEELSVLGLATGVRVRVSVRVRVRVRFRVSVRVRVRLYRSEPARSTRCI